MQHSTLVTADATMETTKFRKTTQLGSSDSINWVSTIILTVPPALTLGAFLSGLPLEWNTLYLTVVFYLLCGFGITAGYHRLWSHRAYTAPLPVQWFLAFFGAGAFQGSIKWWGRNHRIHHRYIDTDKDPYNAQRGFWYSHMGWMIWKQDPTTLGRADVTDFTRDIVVMQQHKFYFPLAMMSGVIMPTLIAGLGWGDYLGGYFYAGILKMVLVHHSTFLINSLAHSSFLSIQSFSNQNSSHDSLLCAFLTFGEGYHNFHHEFPADYRNGIRWYQWDPTKWLIRGLELCGLASRLQRFPQAVIDTNIAHIKRKNTFEKLQKIDAALTTLERTRLPLPSWTMAHVKDLCEKDGRKLTVINGFVLDLESTVDIGESRTHKGERVMWYTSHPGGRPILDAYVGKDATAAFEGTVYRHSSAAKNFVHQLKVAHLL